MITNNLETANLEEMNETEISSFIADFKEYMESEKHVKESMKLRINNLEAENRVLHNKLGDKAEDTKNLKEAYIKISNDQEEIDAELMKAYAEFGY